jgi:hypothetical protein
MAFPTDWSTYWKATPVNPTNNISGFTSYIQLSRLPGLAAIAKADGSDIRVADDSGNQLPCDLMPWYNTGNGLLFFKINKFTSDQPIRVYAGNPSASFEPATGTYGQYATYTAVAFYPSGGGDNRTSTGLNLTMVSANPGDTVFSNIDGRSTAFTTGYGTVSEVDGTPLSFIALGNSLSATLEQSAINLTAPSNTNRHWSLGWDGALASDPIAARVHSAASSVTKATSTGTYSTGVYHHGAAVFTSSTSRVAYSNGVSGQVEITSNIPNLIGRLCVGALRTTSSQFNFSGYLANVAFYSSALSTDYIQYDYNQLNQSSFWGTWTQFSTSTGSTPNYVEITGNFNTTTYTNLYPCVYSDVRNGLVGHWPLQDTGNTYFLSALVGTDGIMTGNRNSTLLSGNVSQYTSSGPGGLIPRSIYFLGSEGAGFGGTGFWGEFNPTGYLRNVSQFSISIWTNLDRFNSRDFIYCMNGNGTSYHRASAEFSEFNTSTGTNQGKITCQASNPDGNPGPNYRAELICETGQWYNVIQSVNIPNNTVKWFINGVPWYEGTGNFFGYTGTTNTNLQGNRIATFSAPPDTNDTKLKGYLADYRIYHRELTSDDARKLYGRGVESCLAGLTLDNIIVSTNSTRTNYRAALEKSATLVSATNTSLTNAANLIKSIRLDSETKTGIDLQTRIESVVSALFNIYTSSEFSAETDSQAFVLAETLMEILTGMTATASLSFGIRAESNTTTSTISSAQLISALSANFSTRTDCLATAVKSISVATESSNHTSFSGTLSLIVDSSAVLDVLTAMDSVGVIEVFENGNEISIMVYIKREEGINPLYINQSRIVEASTRQNMEFN